ncbi:hypothetical protein J6590_063532 [Homalodisca vitripennis]|nr:hypothetical protein J6590_063532 [Homalodisca vitripennis]
MDESFSENPELKVQQQWQKYDHITISTFKTTLFCLSKCALPRGRDIHGYGARGRDDYRTGRHGTVVYEHLPSQSGVHFINGLPNSLKMLKRPKCQKLVLSPFWSQRHSTALTSFWRLTGRPPNSMADFSARSGPDIGGSANGEAERVVEAKKKYSKMILKTEHPESIDDAQIDIDLKSFDNTEEIGEHAATGRWSSWRRILGYSLAIYNAF